MGARRNLATGFTRSRNKAFPGARERTAPAETAVQDRPSDLRNPLQSTDVQYYS